MKHDSLLKGETYNLKNSSCGYTTIIEAPASLHRENKPASQTVRCTRFNQPDFGADWRMGEGQTQCMQDTAHSTSKYSVRMILRFSTILFVVVVKMLSWSKDAINKVKRHPTNWETIFANHVSGKRLGSRIYELLQLVMNYYNLIIKNGQRIRTGNSPGRQTKWPISRWKDVEHH